MRLIDADTLKKVMMQSFGCENATKYGNKNAEQQAKSYSTLMLYEISDIIEDCIDNAPTVEQPTGEWVHDKKSLWDIAKCSLCWETTIGYRNSNYCHKCGAKMTTEGET